MDQIVPACGYDTGCHSTSVLDHDKGVIHCEYSRFEGPTMSCHHAVAVCLSPSPYPLSTAGFLGDVDLAMALARVSFRSVKLLEGVTRSSWW